MKRLLPIVLVVLAGCAQNTTGTPVEINTHCGLAFVTVDHAGQAWRFADADPDEPRSPAMASIFPSGWEDGFNTVYLEETEDGLVAHGPDGRDYRLTERNDERPSGCI